MSKVIYFILLIFISNSCVKNDGFQAKDPIWNKQGCSHCRMILSEKRFAVQKVFESGHRLYYDDINCALLHPLPSEFEGKLFRMFVRAYPSENWVLAEQSMFKSGLLTTMGAGFGAVSEEGDYSFEQVKKLF